MRVVGERAVQRVEVRGQRRARAGRRPVEAPDAAKRPVPELEQPLAVRVLHLLAEVERGLAVRGPVEPRRIAVDVEQERVGERLRSRRCGELAGAAPDEDERPRYDGERE